MSQDKKDYTTRGFIDKIVADHLADAVRLRWGDVALKDLSRNELMALVGYAEKVIDVLIADIDRRDSMEPRH